MQNPAEPSKRPHGGPSAEPSKKHISSESLGEGYAPRADGNRPELSMMDPSLAWYDFHTSCVNIQILTDQNPLWRYPVTFWRVCSFCTFSNPKVCCTPNIMAQRRRAQGLNCWVLDIGRWVGVLHALSDVQWYRLFSRWIIPQILLLDFSLTSVGKAPIKILQDHASVKKHPEKSSRNMPGKPSQVYTTKMLDIQHLWGAWVSLEQTTK